MRPLSALLGALSELGIALEVKGDKLRISGPANALGPSLRAELASRKPEIMAQLAQTDTAQTDTAQKNTAQPIPLLPNQRRLWFIDKFTQSATGFALQTALILPGKFEPLDWQAALDALSKSHPVLNTQVIEVDGVPHLASRAQPLALHIHMEPLPSALPPFAELRPTLDALMRCDIWPNGPDETMVVVSVHHMISDQQSMGIITNCLLAAIQREPLEKPSQSYLDIMAKAATACSADQGEGLAYWTKTLANAPSELTLPFDRPRPKQRGNHGAVHRFTLPKSADLTAISLRCGATPFVTYLSVFAQLLSRWSGQKEAVIGCPMSGRHLPGTEGTVGFFVNSVPLRLDLAQDDIATLIAHAKGVLIGAMEHQEVPFDQIVNALAPERHLNRNPLFQVMFVLQQTGGASLKLGGKDVEVLPVPPLAPDVDLSLALEPGPDGLQAYLEYDPEIFDAETIEVFASQFTSLCSHYNDIPTKDAALAQWHGGTQPRPELDIGQLLAAHLASFPPDHPVLQDADGVLERSALEQRALAVAHELECKGAGSGSHIGVCLDTTRDRLAAMLGVWHIGASLVFLPHTGPAQVRRDRIAQGGLTHVIGATGGSVELPTDVKMVAMDAVQEGPAPKRRAATGPAYLCFTSGTTGAAKAVAVGHASLVNHVISIAEAFELTPADRVLQFANPSFDMVFEDMLPALLSGATLIAPQSKDLQALDQFERMLTEYGVTVANLPAPFWHSWVQEMAQLDGSAPTALRLLITGSDLVQSDCARLWRQHCPNVRFLSGYGLTETTITALLHEPSLDPADIPAGALPLGLPLPNISLSIMGPDGTAVPPLVVGEIAISGQAVADGYRGAEETGRFKTGPEGRFYLTGDLGRMRRDGALEFLGRQDRQVKIRGIRVDPSEVEASFNTLDDVTEAAVIARPNAAGQWQLVGYYRGQQSKAGTYSKALGARLPAAMVPTHLIALERLPRTEAGKIDRRALERLPLNAPQAPTRDATPHELRLAAIFAQVLQCETVGPDDNFFSLGGNSISSLQIVARARRAGFDLTAAQVFEHQTVAALAAHVTINSAANTRAREHGTLHATPILAWYATQFHQPWRQFNQSVMLALPDHLDPKALTCALGAMVAPHEIFALTVDVTKDTPYKIAETAQAPVLYICSGAEDRDLDIARLQQSLDPATGRNVAALWLQDENRLLLTIHHLCVDVLSWDILLRDLEAAYEAILAGHDPAIAPRGTSFRLWAERLEHLAASPESTDILDGLVKTLSGPVSPLIASPDANCGTDANAVAIRCELPARISSELLRNVPVSYGLRMDETLILALLLVHERRGGTGLRIDLERNGRASPFADLNLADTVGWFTALLPLRLDAGDDIAALAARVRRATAESPLDGLGYGLMRYGADPIKSQTLETLPGAEILLNYVGILTGWSEGPFRPIDADCGPTIAPETQRSHMIELNAGVVAGCIRLELMVPQTAAETATDVIGQLQTALVDIAHHARRARFGLELGDDVDDVLPVTPLQNRILLHSLHKSDTYIDQIHFQLDGPLDMGAMQRAWATLTDRHKGLRTTFAFAADNRPVQIIRKKSTVDWRRLDWRDLDAPQVQPMLQNLMSADRDEGLDLETGPLMRMHMVQTGETTHQWIWSAHHLILDGWSVSVVMQEWQTLYETFCEGTSHSLPVAADLADHSAWLDRLDTKGARAFWSEYLSGTAPTLLAPHRETGLAAEQSGSDTIPLSPDVMAQMNAFAADVGTTPALVAQAAWALVLRRYGAPDSAVFGLTISNRPAEMPEIEDLVGMLINTIPVRVDLNADETPRALLTRMTVAAQACAQWSNLAFDEILDASDLPDGALPFDSLMVVQNYPRPEGLTSGGLSLHLAEVFERTDLPLTLLLQSGTDPSLTIVWDGAQMPAALAQQLLRHWHKALQQITAQADAPICEASIYTAADLHTRLARAQGPAPVANTPRAVSATRHWARFVPHYPALLADDAKLTYAELDSAVQGLASQLLAQGMPAGTAIAILLPRSARAIVAFLAVLRAGGIAVPVDPTYPTDRIAHILGDCDAKLVITDISGANTLADDKRKTLLLETLDQIVGSPIDLPLPASTAPAYLIYTSGSTGLPKGTLTHHGGIDNMIAAQQHAFNLGAADRVLQFASLSFDASVWEIFMALGAGAQLFVPSRTTALAGADLATYLDQSRISIATLPPAVITGLPATPLKNLKALIAAGEACPPGLADRWAGQTRFFNAYGPSEASVCATLHEHSAGGSDVPIGLPISGCAAYVVDQDNHLVPFGGTGELVIGGAGVGLGYHARPELTARAFCRDPWRQDKGARIYRTGDLVAVKTDGSLLFRGRKDRQIKLRGFRIEPGEIENALMQISGVERALVNSQNPGDPGAALIAWVLLQRGTQLDPAALRAHLATQIPSHMVPNRVHIVDAIALTPNGKIDWDALRRNSAAAPAAHPPQAAEPEESPPQSDLTKLLTDIWAELLGSRAFSSDQNFFDAGGHSLLLVRMQPMLFETFGLQVRIPDLFKNPTIDALKKLLLAQAPHLNDAPAPLLAPQPSAPQPRLNASPPNAMPIAIVGMACRFPGAADLDAFWDLLEQGREGISDLSRDILLAAGETAAQIENPAYVARRGSLENTEAFDAEFFGISPRDAQLMDPQHRLFLECAWHALEDAGQVPRSGQSTGVFAGSGYNTWLNEVLRPAGETLTGSAGFHAVTANEKDFLATQTAFRLDLRGPAVSVQTACSTSLVAVTQAVAALRNGTCQTAIAGGVALGFPANRGYLFESDMILSPDGHCRPFSADAAGTVPSEGVGAVILKPLDQATADGDRIYAVIRGVGMGNDGARKMSFAAPSADGQVEAMRAALKDAGLQGADVDLLEAHGTGTSLGDPVEMTAIARVYAKRQTPLSIGSVKGNIGHSDAAAGIAGFIKAALSLHRSIIPASLHAERLNPRLNLADGRLHIATQTTPWAQSQRPNRAAVSSFGIGGTNAHVVLEAAPASVSTTPHPSDDTGKHILPISAHTAHALQTLATGLATQLKMNAVSLADVASSLQSGRAALRYRTAIVAADRAEAISALQTITPAEPGTPKAAFLFPGQGTQHLMMGRAAYDRFAVYRDHLDDIDARLAPVLGLSIRALMWEDTPAAAARLRDTRYAQLAVFAVSVSTARLWLDLGVTPAAVLGHSVGEFAAAHIAGVLDLDEALRLLNARSQLIAAQPAGSMLAAALSQTEAQPFLSPTVGLAAINSAEQVVFSGPQHDIQSLYEQLRTNGVACRKLDTSHAFHSTMMQPARAAFADLIDPTKLSPPKIPMISTVTGDWVETDTLQRPGYWADHICQPVRFSSALRRLEAAGNITGLDIGPGQTVATLAETGGVTCLASHEATTADRNTDTMMATIARMWSLGAPIKWQALAQNIHPKVTLPLYPFERQTHSPLKKPLAQDLPPKRANADEWFYTVGFQPIPKPPMAPLLGPVVIATDTPHAATGLRGLMGVNDTANVIDLMTAPPASAFDGHHPPPSELLLIVSGAHADTCTLVQNALALIREFAKQSKGSGGIRLVTQNATATFPNESPQPMLAALRSAIEVLVYEYPELAISGIDLAEFTDQPIEVPIAQFLSLRPDGYFAPCITEMPLPDQPDWPLPSAAKVLITGGFGGVGSAIANALARDIPNVKLLLTSRTDRPNDPLLERLRKAGATAEALHVDVALGAAAGEYLAAHGPVDLIIHAAGTADYGGILARRDAASIDEVLAPKISGLTALGPLLDLSPQTPLVFCSTLGSLLPAAKFGQTAYSAANSYLDASALHRSAQGRPTVSINWDDWVGAGMTEDSRERAGEAGLNDDNGLRPDEGTNALKRILHARCPQIAVSVRDLPKLVNHSIRRLSSPPQTPNGAPPERRLNPAEDLQENLLKLFREALGDPSYTAQDDFFARGGHSLLAMQLLGRIRDQLGHPCALSNIFETPTPMALAQALQDA
ncbi:MAG: amino acid adenylation domain-containing protein [Sulfitobacter sp.]